MILFATVKFHISYEKRLKLGEQRKIPGVKITRVCANLSAHGNCHVGWGTFVTTCIMSCLHMWEFVWEKQKKRSMELNTKHSISVCE